MKENNGREHLERVLKRARNQLKKKKKKKKRNNKKNVSIYSFLG